MSDRKKTIDDLRSVLFETLQQVKNGAMPLDKARAINELGKTLVDTARVEVDYLRATGGTESPFIEPDDDDDQKPLPPGITGRTVHRLK